MDSEQQNFENPNFLENLIRQKQLMNGPLGGGLPQSIPENSQPNSQPSPDLTVHHLHGTLDSSPVTPQAQNAINPQASPVPKIGPIDPNSANPAESAYKQAIMNEPMHSDYHPSKLRNVLSKIAGAGVGAFNGGPEGARVMAGIRDQPYNSQHNDWQQFAKNRGVLATEEIAGNEAAGKSALTQAQTDEQNSLGKLHSKQANIIAPDMATDVANKVTEAQGHLKVDTREAKMLDGTIKHLVQRNGLFYDPETATTTNPNGVRIDRAAIEDISDEGKSLRETKQSRIPGNLGASIKAKQIVAAGVGGKTEDGEKIDQPTFEAAKQFDEALSAGKEPAGAFARIIKDRNSERVAAGQKPMTSAEEEALQVKLLSVEKPLQQMLVNPSDNTTFRAVPNMKLPEGAQTPQQIGNASAKTAADQKSLKEDQAFVNDYLNNQTHTGPGDEALLERFFNVTKPSTGFRMNQAQIALLTKLRSFSSTVKAFMAHATGGTLFDDKQRKEIADTINQITNSKLGQAPETLPGGTTIQDIDAEIARRKGQK